MKRIYFSYIFSLFFFLCSYRLTAPEIYINNPCSLDRTINSLVLIRSKALNYAEKDSIDLNATHFYLLAYFNTYKKNRLLYALSTDGLSWTKLNEGKPIFKPNVGSEKIMRDPSICKGQDGKFHLVWTSGWSGKDIGYASSVDLVHWNKIRPISVAHV